eukprot:scaffold264740_cov24-Prasinocladus_malaysianus.AAC.1
MENRDHSSEPSHSGALVYTYSTLSYAYIHYVAHYDGGKSTLSVSQIESSDVYKQGVGAYPICKR